MTTVLILSVGGSADPLVHAIDQNRPDFVYFLCSGGDTDAASQRLITDEVIQVQKGNCPYCKRAYETRGSNPPIPQQAGLTAEQYAIYSVNNPDDLGEVLRRCEAISLDIATRFPARPRVVANYTGGTKTMTLGLGIYALRKAPEWEVQFNASGKRTNLIKIERGDIALPVELHTFYHQSLEEELNELEEKSDYESAVVLLHSTLTRVPFPESIREQLAVRKCRIEMLAAHDRFEYKEAISHASQMSDSQEKFYKKLKHINDILEAGKPWRPETLSGHELVEDVVQNAERCALRHRFDDAIARLYRATELLAQVKLYRDYGLQTGKLDISHPAIPGPAKPWLEKKKNSKGIVKIALQDGYRLLQEMNDALGDYWKAQEEKLRGFIEKRNLSFLAHGFKPITQSTWNHEGRAWRAWLRAGIDIIKR
ncbi:MAG TPA: TIGR02710 family CRISPR-associated CARF protein [bacterium]|nr:TIGR02710 family CRISPR-associated CARF protein [bacterium]